jgi:hypothetical protein
VATSFPTSLDTLTNPSGGDQRSSPSHAAQHTDANDAIEALEAKVGVNGSAVTTSLDFLANEANAWGSDGFESGTYYAPQARENSFQASNRTIGQVSYTPIFIGCTQSFDRIAVKSGSTLSGTMTIRLGIYNNTNQRPSTVLLDAGTVAASAVNTIYSITINQSLSAGWYWLAAVVTATTGTSPLITFADVRAFPKSRLTTSLTFLSVFTQSGVTGTFATATSLTGTNVSQVFVALRAA